MKSSLVAFALLALVACDKKSSGDAPAPSASAAVALASAAPSVIASAPTSSASAPSTTAASSWTGSYKSAGASLYVPTQKPFDIVKWRGDDAGGGVGDGTLELSVDSTGQISGTGSGALGPVVVSGMYGDGELTATLARKDPSDGGFTGTAVGKLAGDTIEGTIHLSLPNANSLRTATFTLSKKP
jgi:hypothetical protein